MKPFSKNETIGVSLILLFLVVISLYNFRISLRRARDAQRKADLGAIANALDKYSSDFGTFPLSSPDGKIRACLSPGQSLEELKAKITEETDFFALLSPCEWGEDGLKDVLDPSYPFYLTTIPQDPKKGEGLSYAYFSNRKRFQLYAYLEGGKAEEGYREGIVERNIACGAKICSFGKAFSETPLEKSIQEYENELLQEKLKMQN